MLLIFHRAGSVNQVRCIVEKGMEELVDRMVASKQRYVSTKHIPVHVKTYTDKIMDVTSAFHASRSKKWASHLLSEPIDANTPGRGESPTHAKQLESLARELEDDADSHANQPAHSRLDQEYRRADAVAARTWAYSAKSTSLHLACFEGVESCLADANRQEKSYHWNR